MAELPLDQAIPRFKANENRMDIFTNGSDTTDMTTSSGVPVPSIRKFLKNKGVELSAQMAAARVYDDATSLATAVIPLGTKFVRTAGFKEPSDGGAGFYRRMGDDETDEPGQLVSNDSAVRWGLVEDFPLLAQFGAVGDGVTDDIESIVAWKNYCQSFNVTGLVSAKTYYTATNPAFGSAGGMTMLAERGACFKGIISHDPGVVVTGTNEIDVWNYDADEGIDNHYKFTPAFAVQPTLKSMWIDGGDLDRSIIRAVDAAEEMSIFNLGYSADTFSGTTAASATADALALTVSPGAYTFAMMASYGASEISAAWDDSGSFTQSVIIRTSTGWWVFSAMDLSSGALSHKPIGSPLEETTGIEWPGRFHHQSYQSQNALWTIRNWDGKTFSVLLNGKEVVRHEVDGFITEWGFGGADETEQLIAVRDFTLRTGMDEPTGLSVLDIVTAGDSYSSPAHGGWQDYFRRALDGTMGIEVRSLNNIAVAGNNSTEQLAAIDAYFDALDGAGEKATDLIVMIGVNDQQQAVSTVTLKANILAMAARAASSGARAHFVLQPPYYGPDLTRNDQAPYNYKAVGLYRAAIMRAAAEAGCTCIDMMQRLKRVQQDQLTDDGSTDPGIFDNIHPTTYARMQYAYAIARGLVGALSRKMTRAIRPQDIPPYGYLNGWAANTRTPKISFDAEGNVRLSGCLDCGTKTAGTAIYKLPPNARPEVSMLIEVFGQYTTKVTLDLSTDGTIYLVPDLTSGGDSFISLDGIEFAPGA